MSFPAISDPETLYRMALDGAWRDGLDAVHRRPADDPRFEAATAVFLAAFFAALDGRPGSPPPPDADALDRLLLLHSGRFVTLPGERLEDVVVRLVRYHEATPERALGYARFCPANPRCAALLRQFGVPLPAAHPQAATLRLDVAGDDTAPPAVRSLFRSGLEEAFFHAARAVFADALVYPNVALHAVLDYERLRPHLSAAERRYFFHALIDCVVFAPDDGYRPRFFFELDSPFHDADDRQARDRLKDRLLARAGHRLYRIRPEGRRVEHAALVALLREIAG